MSTFRLYFRALFGTFFLKVFLEYDSNEKKDPVPCLDVIMIAFFPKKYTVKDHISNTKLGKGDHYYIQTQHKDLFSNGLTDCLAKGVKILDGVTFI